jgi:hypothetical protein
MYPQSQPFSPAGKCRPLDLDLDRPSTVQVLLAALIGGLVALYLALCLRWWNVGALIPTAPLLVGFGAGLLSPSQSFRASLCALGACLLLAFFTLQQQAVYVLWAVPVIWPMLWLGAFTGSTLVRLRRYRRAFAALTM